MEGLIHVVRRQPLHGRLWLLTSLAVAAAILLSNVAGYVALRVTLYQASETLATSVAQDLVAPAAESLRQTGELDDAVRQAGGVIVEAVSPDGTVLGIPGETRSLVLEPADLTAIHGTSTHRVGVDAAGAAYMIVAVPLGDRDQALVVGRPLRTIQDVLAAERVILLLVVAASLLTSMVVAAFVARSALQPVRQLTLAVQHATDTKDFQPISIRYVAGYLATLAAAFNALLRSVSQMRERQARLVADAGHELRTPLTSLMTNVDLLAADLTQERLSVQQRGMILTDLKAQLAELTDLVGDLVRLSRDDSGVELRPLDLRHVVHAAVDRVRRRGSDRVFDVRLDELHLVGDADGLERAVTNVLDNAVKWSPPGSTIRVRLEGNRLRVADSGPGIPEADRPFVFDRFFRGETARKTHGTGLGLSIVAKTVEEHGGSVEVGSSDDGGAEVTLRLPGVRSTEALSRLLIPA